MNRRASVRPALIDQVGPKTVAEVADIFALLSDPGRLRILLVLVDGEASVGAISARISLSHSATSHALRLLRAHEVVQVRRLGRMAFYRLADGHVRELIGSALEHQDHARITHPERLSVTTGAGADSTDGPDGPDGTDRTGGTDGADSTGRAGGMTGVTG